MTYGPEDRFNDFPGGPGSSPPEKPGYDGPPGNEVVETDPDARNMAMLAHLLGAFLGIFGPLIIWLMKKDEMPFVDQQGKDALNFHITLLIAYLVSSDAWIVLSFVTCGFGSFLFLPAIVGIAQIVLGIMAGMEASQGKRYEYPFNYHWIQ